MVALARILGGLIIPTVIGWNPLDDGFGWWAVGGKDGTAVDSAAVSAEHDLARGGPSSPEGSQKGTFAAVRLPATLRAIELPAGRMESLASPLRR